MQAIQHLCFLALLRHTVHCAPGHGAGICHAHICEALESENAHGTPPFSCPPAQCR